jgi:hypothetical protein
LSILVERIYGYPADAGKVGTPNPSTAAKGDRRPSKMLSIYYIILLHLLYGLCFDKIIRPVLPSKSRHIFVLYGTFKYNSKINAIYSKALP